MSYRLIMSNQSMERLFLRFNEKYILYLIFFALGFSKSWIYLPLIGFYDTSPRKPTNLLVGWKAALFLLDTCNISKYINI